MRNNSFIEAAKDDQLASGRNAWNVFERGCATYRRGRDETRGFGGLFLAKCQSLAVKWFAEERAIGAKSRDAWPVISLVTAPVVFLCPS